MQFLERLNGDGFISDEFLMYRCMILVIYFTVSLFVEDEKVRK